jgi:hypothetical protein
MEAMALQDAFVFGVLQVCVCMCLCVPLCNPDGALLQPARSGSRARLECSQSGATLATWSVQGRAHVGRATKRHTHTLSHSHVRLRSDTQSLVHTHSLSLSLCLSQQPSPLAGPWKDWRWMSSWCGWRASKSTAEARRLGRSCGGGGGGETPGTDEQPRPMADFHKRG